MKRKLFKIQGQPALIATEKTNPGMDEWYKLGQPMVLIKVKEVPEERVILYEDVGFGRMILKKATRFYVGSDLVLVGKWVGVGTYFGAKQAQLFKKV